MLGGVGNLLANRLCNGLLPWPTLLGKGDEKKIYDTAYPL
jgi:hypothetical protein